MPSKSPRPERARSRAAGFVITLEFLLVMALFVLPLLIGAVLLGRKLYTLYLNQREFTEQPYSRAVVWDSTNPGPTPPPKVVGPVIGYDQYEAPLVIFRHVRTKAGVILGVRTDRFTSYGQVFYTGTACDGTAYVRSDYATVASGTYPPIGFAYQMQGVSYAMGAGDILYASAATPGVSGDSTTPSPIQSVWISQDVSPAVAGPGGAIPPCFAVADAASVLNLVPGGTIIHLGSGSPTDGFYQPPFRVAFPSPGAAVTLPCPTGECTTP